MISTNHDIFLLKEFLFILFGAIGMTIYKFLSWVMPKTAKIFWEGIKSILKEAYDQNNQEVLEEIKTLRDEVKNYREKKHELEGENLLMIQAIVEKDEDKLKIIRKIYNKNDQE